MADRQSLCVALDGSDRDWILSTARNLAGHVGWLKIGLEAFVAHGPNLVGEVADTGVRVFLDLKLHDIPATVRRASTNCAAAGAAMITIHASGGPAMIEAATEGVRAGSAGVSTQVVAVTVLTSLDQTTLNEIGWNQRPEQLAGRLALLARDGGVDGVVSSAHEAAVIRRLCGDRFVIVTPGIRPAQSDADDQRRVVTPAEAIQAGSNILVIGRPITRSPHPIQAVESILEEMGSQA